MDALSLWQNQQKNKGWNVGLCGHKCLGNLLETFVSGTVEGFGENVGNRG